LGNCPPDQVPERRILGVKAAGEAGAEPWH